MPGQDARDGSSLSTSLRPAATFERRLIELANRLGVPAPATDWPVTGVTHDSAAVRAGDLYAALPGSHTHGARFSADAVAAGAVGVLTDETGRTLSSGVEAPLLVVDNPRERLGDICSWIYGEPSTRMRVLGVTGTNGKTTTSYLLDAGLRAAGETTGLIGTIETRVGDIALPSARTTPEAPDLQALLAVMAERGVGSVSMEVSSHALALNRVDGTAFDVVAFSNLSQDHLDFHVNLDDYFAAKARLFTPEFAPRGVVNIDDEYGRRLSHIAPIPVTTVSTITRDAEWWASDVSAQPRGSRFVVHGPGVEIALAVRLAGGFNVANALLAFVTLVQAGVDPGAAAAGIAEVSVVPGRMEAVSVGQPFVALVDYAHTPEAVVTLLTTLRATTTGRLIVVLGCGGDRDRVKRPLMGAAAARLADVAVLTSDNPRSEEPAQILVAVLEGAMGVPAAQRGEVVVELDRRTAISIAVGRARAGDVVVVAGKGHEQGQEVGGVVHPFDDRAVLRDEVAALARTTGAS
ncbi:MAG TPA: UDP-N-acetylmuramoyl-L-alanyl-D-glutamate--2,6-diaminopimelate ligase [Acidothermaceae bacterium]|nr:UDP-N-acetylmuramoyl-L-alanyl-D-glutamate--2,6-diaminopimelate ligase [Acidothermaceae bacterium]